MLYRSIQVFIILLISAFGCAVVSAQSAEDGSSLFSKPNDKDQAVGIRDMLEKMRIEKEKKDHEEMLKRGQDALDLSDELEKAIDNDQKLTEKDRAKLETLEKLVKKIRGELGGADDDGANDAEKDEKPSSMVHGFKILRSATIMLVDELKKTTRFSISAAAIQTSNSVLRIARYLRFWK